MREKSAHSDLSPRLLNHFLCAGGSALILSIAHIYPEYWFVSLFALVPFLWRVIKANLPDSIFLGIILAACYAFVAFIGEALASPGGFLLKLLFLSLVFSIFGVSVNLVKKYIGFYPIFIAALWLPVEYVLAHHAGLKHIFAFSHVDSSIMFRFASLFGFLMVSFCIVLINALILLILERVRLKVFSSCKFRFAREIAFHSYYENIILQKSWFFFSDPRAPPITALLN